MQNCLETERYAEGSHKKKDNDVVVVLGVSPYDMGSLDRKKSLLNFC